MRFQGCRRAHPRHRPHARRHQGASRDRAAKPLGGTIGGISRFASGVILQAQKVAWSWPAFICVIGRALAVPLVVHATMMALHTGAELRRMVALALAAAPMQVILAVPYRVHQQENATLLLLSNLLSIPGLAVFIWLTG